MDFKEASYSAIDCKNAGYSVIECKTGGYSAIDCKAAGYSFDAIIAAGFSGSDIADAFGLRKLENIDDPERRVGARVLCEGKLGKITKHQWGPHLWNLIQVEYDDGTINRNMFKEYLRFTNKPTYDYPTEDVWAGFGRYSKSMQNQ